MNDLATMQLTEHGRVLAAALVGEVDLSNTETLRSTLVDAVPADAVGLVLDLQGLEYLDSAGVRLLFHLSERLRERRQVLRVVVTHPSPVHRVLDLVSLRESVPIDESLADALDALGVPASDRH